MPAPFFEFKQFTVWHDRCAMKVGTDGVILGAWAHVEKNDTALDVGAGSGLIALMLAQRGCSTVHAIDIDEDACTQAKANTEASKWKQQIAVFQANYAHFKPTSETKYQRIVSNPPFFNQSLKGISHSRNLARHSIQLNWQSLIRKSFDILVDKGTLSVILPWPEAREFTAFALINGFYERRITLVETREGIAPKRVLLEFSKQYEKAERSTLTIRSADNEYSIDYKNLTKDFYLNF
jgi:tRNA1Val (adenine37-N6)-methyltransferase